MFHGLCGGCLSLEGSASSVSSGGAVRFSQEGLPTHGSVRLGTFDTRTLWDITADAEPPAVILVDSTTSDIISRTDVCLRRTPLHCGFETFQRPPSYSSFIASDSQPSPNPHGANQPPSSLASQIISNLVGTAPLQSNWSESPPTPVDIAQAGPLRLIISEWMIYSQVVARFLKHYEFSLNSPCSAPRSPVISNAESIDLQKWKHRLIASQSKLASTRDYIGAHSPPAAARPSQDLLMIQDLTHLKDKFDRYAHAFERVVPIATSVVQISEHRRSVADSAALRRLTYIAFVFVPASWVAAIFSMASEFGPGQPKFWVYFAVSVPFCAAIILGSLLVSGTNLVTFWDDGTWDGGRGGIARKEVAVGSRFGVKS